MEVKTKTKKEANAECDNGFVELRPIGEVERTGRVVEESKNESNTVNARCIVSTKANSMKVQSCDSHMDM